MQILLNRKWSSQDATGIFDAMITTFKKHNLSSLLQKVIFLSSDGVSETVGISQAWFISSMKIENG